ASDRATLSVGPSLRSGRRRGVWTEARERDSLPDWVIQRPVSDADGAIRPQSCSLGENMASPEEYEAVMLGSGVGGKLLVRTIASQGTPVAVIEPRYIGVSCPNIACLPSKNVIQSAKVATYFQRAAEFGIAAGEWKVAMSGVRDRKRKMVEGLVELHLG